MVYVWNWIALPALLGGPLLATLAALVLASRPRHLQNRVLALVLVLEATSMMAGAALMYMTDDVAHVYAWQVVAYAAFPGAVLVYLVFLSTLDTPLARPFRPRSVRLALIASAAAFPVFAAIDPRFFVEGLFPWDLAPWNVINGSFELLIPLFMLVFLYGLATAVDAHRRAPPRSAARRQTGAYLAAFALRDAGFVAVFAVLLWGPERAGDLAAISVMATLSTAFGLLLAFGILRTQLFGVELHAKFALRQSTVAAVLGGLFFVTGEVVEQALGLEGPVLGLAGAAAIVVALLPARHLAQVVADHALPGVEDTPSYRRARSEELYRAAFESALFDGTVTDRERAVLETLRDRLEISPADSRRLEAEVQAIVPA